MQVEKKGTVKVGTAGDGGSKDIVYPDPTHVSDDDEGKEAVDGDDDEDAVADDDDATEKESEDDSKDKDEDEEGTKKPDEASDKAKEKKEKEEPKKGDDSTTEKSVQADKSKEDTKVQDRDKNHEEAEKRRNAEREKRAAYVEGIKAAVGGKNTFTGEEMKTEDDVVEYENMLEAKKRGMDPIADYHKFIKAQAQEKRAAEAEESKKATEAAESRKKDIDNFKEAYPDVDLQKLLTDEDFKKDFGKFLGRMPLLDIYELHQKVSAGKTQSKEEEEDKKEARRVSTPGPLGKTAVDDGFYTKAELDKMTPAEVHDNWSKVQKSYAKIAASKKN